MYMNSNEPFQRVNEGTSPLVTGLAGAIGVGGAAAAFQGLNYASYTGIDKEFERGRKKDLKNQLKPLEKQLSNATKSKNQARDHAFDNIDTMRSINKNRDAVNKKAVDSQLIAENSKGPKGWLYDKLASHHENKSLTMNTDRVAQMHQLNQNREKVRTNRAEERAVREQINQTKTNTQYSERWNESSFQAKKEAHGYHGKSFKTSAKTAGLFAAGGFVAGGAVQMLGNQISNA